MDIDEIIESYERKRVAQLRYKPRKSVLEYFRNEIASIVKKRGDKRGIIKHIAHFVNHKITYADVKAKESIPESRKRIVYERLKVMRFATVYRFCKNSKIID